MGEFVDQARLAHPSLGNERHDLTVTVIGKLLRPAKLFQLGVAADEPRQPTTGDCLEPGPRRANARQFVDFQRIGEPLDRHRDRATSQ